jgi:hypothetical protein
MIYDLVLVNIYKIIFIAIYPASQMKASRKKWDVRNMRFLKENMPRRIPNYKGWLMIKRLKNG